MGNGRPCGWRRLGLAAALMLPVRAPAIPAQAPATHVLIIVGASGEPRFATAFHAEAMALRAAILQAGVPDSLVQYLAEDPSRQPGAITGRSNKDGVRAAFAKIASRARPDDQVFVLLLGHGSADDEVARFNVPGPDLTDAEFDAMLDGFSGRTVAFVNASSASGDFVKRLAGPDRILITATKSGFERNETLFGGQFVQAYAKEGADTDKDGRVSLLEAFVYARREVARAYEQSNRLQTEHAVLDDDGDGVGRGEPGAEGPDGARARSFFLAPAPGVSAAAASDPRAAALLATQARLQKEIDSLRVIKTAMPEAEYEKALEERLVKLAETTQALRALGVRKP